MNQLALWVTISVTWPKFHNIDTLCWFTADIHAVICVLTTAPVDDDSAQISKEETADKSCYFSIYKSLFVTSGVLSFQTLFDLIKRLLSFSLWGILNVEFGFWTSYRIRIFLVPCSFFLTFSPWAIMVKLLDTALIALTKLHSWKTLVSNISTISWFESCEQGTPLCSIYGFRHATTHAHWVLCTFSKTCGKMSFISSILCSL